MGLWDDFKDTVSDVVDAITDPIDEAGEAVSEALSDIFDGVSSGLENIFTEMGLGWLGRVLNGALVLVGISIKATVGIIAGALTGTIKIIGGIISLDKDIILDGLEDILAPIAGAIIMMALQTVALVQTILYLQKDRPLNKEERALIRRVFHHSLATYCIRIVEGTAGIFGLISSRPFVMGNTIYMKNKKPMDEPEVFVHECIHVWQYQHLGVKYISNAAFAQAAGEAYNWLKFYIDDGITHWREFNKESQGEFFEDLYVEGEKICGVTPMAGNGVFFDELELKCTHRFVHNTYDFTDFAEVAVAYIREEKSYRWISQNVN